MSGQEPRTAAELWDEWLNDEDMNGSGRVLLRHYRPLIEAALSAPSPRATEAALAPLRAWLDEQDWMPTSAVESILLFARAALARPADPVPGTDPQTLDVRKLAQAMLMDDREDHFLIEHASDIARHYASLTESDVDLFMAVGDRQRRYARLTEGA